MRIIAGSRRSLQLNTTEGKETRPTTDRIKETLFNMLQFQLQGIDFLDIFAGSGGIGLEALSRGADRAVFIESSPLAAKCIEDNISHCSFTEESRIIRADFMAGLSKLDSLDYHFGVVFMDPPYEKGLERRAMALLKGRDYVDKDTVFIVEAALTDNISPDIEEMGYILIREKSYKTNKHVFFRLGEK